MASLVIAKKDLKSLFREKTVVLTLLLLVALSSLSQIVATGLVFLYNPSFEFKARIGLVGNAPIFERVANPMRFENLSSALNGLRKGYVDAVVVLNENPKGVNYVEVYVPKEEVKSIRVIPYLKRVFEEYQTVLRELNGIPVLNVRSYDTEGRPISVPEGISLKFRFIYVVLIPTVIVLCGIIVGIYTIDVLYEELKTSEVLLTSVGVRDVVIGKIVAVFTVSSMLTLVWILGFVANGIKVSIASVLPSLMFCILSSSIAMIVFGFSDSREQAQLIYSLLFIPLILSFLTFTPSPLSLSVKFSLRIFDDTLTFAIAFGVVDLIMLSSSYLIVKGRITKSL